jgi:hydroxymethylbilane synthase
LQNGAAAALEKRLGKRAARRLGLIAALDGDPLLREQRTARPDEAEATGRALAEALLERGGRAVLQEVREV